MIQSAVYRFRLFRSLLNQGGIEPDLLTQPGSERPTYVSQTHDAPIRCAAEIVVTWDSTSTELG